MKEALNKFEKLLNDNPDDYKADIFPFKSFIRSFLRIKTNNVTLPLAEIITIIKNEKPKIYYSLKKATSYDLLFQFLNHIDIEHSKARRNLMIIKESIL